jgi:FAD/FMN-containing dehydrogenase
LPFGGSRILFRFQPPEAIQVLYKFFLDRAIRILLYRKGQQSVEFHFLFFRFNKPSLKKGPIPMDANCIRDLAGIVGEPWVTTDDEHLKGYAKDNSFVPPRMPQCVARPGSAEDLEETVRWANRTRTPLVPVSSGEPRLRGDTIPRLGGAVVDLQRMKRIVRIDRRNRVAVIEPGVTFGELVPALAREGLRLNGPLLPRSNKSVLASVLEREPGLMPRYQWDISDPLCCLEVVFGTGDRFRTGEAAGPGGLEAQWRIGGAQKFPLGPHQVDYHRLVQGAQGTMGIATWASIKCEILPKAKKLFFLHAERIEDLVPLAYELTKKGYGDEVFLMNRVELAALLKGAGILPEFQAAQTGLPSWVLTFCISGGAYFPEEQLEVLEKDLKELAQSLGQVFSQTAGDLPAARMLSLLDRCSDEPYWKYGVLGQFREIFFITTLDRSPRFIETVRLLAGETGVPESRIGVYLQPVVQGTSCHCEFDLFFDGEDAKESAKTRELFERASSALIRQGAFFSRPYPAWADEVYRTQGTFAETLKKVKAVFDPNGILNPGKLCF